MSMASNAAPLTTEKWDAGTVAVVTGGETIYSQMQLYTVGRERVSVHMCAHIPEQQCGICPVLRQKSPNLF